MSELPISMPVDDINPRNTRRALLNVSDYRKDRDHFRDVWRHLSQHAVHKTDAKAVPVRSEAWETSFLRIYELALHLASQEPKVQLKNFLRDLRDRSFLNSKSHCVEAEIFSTVEADSLTPAEDNVLEFTILPAAASDVEEVVANEGEERFPDSTPVESKQSELVGPEIPEPRSAEESIEIQPLRIIPPENADKILIAVISATDDEEFNLAWPPPPITSPLQARIASTAEIPSK